MGEKEGKPECVRLSVCMSACARASSARREEKKPDGVVARKLRDVLAVEASRGSLDSFRLLSETLRPMCCANSILRRRISMSP